MTRPVRILFGTVVAILALAIIAVVTIKIVFTRDRILAMLTPRVEKTVKRPVQIGDAGISLWGGIGVRLGDVTIGNRPGFSSWPFLTLRSVDVKARFWQLLSGRVEIDHVDFDQPSVLLEYDAAGRSNLDDLVTEEPHARGAAESGSSAKALAAPLILRHVVIKGGSLVLDDAQARRHLGIRGADLDVTMPFDPAQTEHGFELRTAFDSLDFRQTDKHWSVPGRDLDLFARGAWTPSAKSIRFDSLLVRWRDGILLAQGEVHVQPAVWEIQVNASLLPMPLAEALDAVREAWPHLGSARPSGTIQAKVEASFVWPLPAGSVPDWHANLDLSDVHWPLPSGQRDITCSRVELRGGAQTVSCLISGGRLQDGTFSLNATIDQLFNPGRTISAHLQADLPVEGLPALISDSIRWTSTGRIAADLTGFGPLGDWMKTHVDGHIASDRLVLADTSWSFDSLSATFDLQCENEHLSLHRFDWIAGESNGAITGQIDNLLPAVLSKFKSPDVPRAQLSFNCRRLNLDQLTGETPPEGSATAGTVTIPIPPLAVTGDLTCDTLIYSGLTIAKAKSPFTFKYNVMTLAPIEGHLYGGKLAGSLIWNVGSWPNPSFETTLSADSVQANDILSRYFGWTGGVFGSLSLDGEFSGRGRYAREILPTLTARGNSGLRSGRLEAAPILARISQQIGIKGLDRPHTLRDLGAPFRIAAGRLFTDNLRFATDNAQYEISGSFGFDHTLDYQVKVIAQSTPGMPRELQGIGVRFALRGTVEDPVATLNAGETGRAVIQNFMQKATDSLKSALPDALKNLFKPHKP